MDPIMLARMQFAANITFHILFPTITIALAWVLLFFKLRFQKTADTKWMDAYRFWVKVFALTFAIGVVSGVTMSFQFGTNWPGFMEKVGNIAGPLLGYEVLTAFFLEASFLGIMLFGINRVSNTVHTIATALVAFGTALSAFFILALNAWMQTPAGFEMIDGKAHVTSWWEVIFNPSFGWRFAHMMLASFLTGAFLIAGIAAYRWLRSDRSPEVIMTLKTGMYAAAFLIPIQVLIGDGLGLNTLKYQPAKIAAMEALWETTNHMPLVLFGFPNTTTKTNDYELAIPGLGSWILTHSAEGEVKGLNEFEGMHPPVAPLFWGFRIMVGVGFLMLFVAWTSTYFLMRKPVLPAWMAKVLVMMTFSGWVATITGWYVTEIGRQPYLVYGVLTTAEAASAVPGTMIAFTLVAYLVLYVALTIAYITALFYMARNAKKIEYTPQGGAV